MEINELPDFVDDAFDFPIDVETVIESIGDRTIDAPDRDDSEDLSTILNRAGEKTFETPDALLTAIRGNVSDEYVGRKYYDDRGANPQDRDDTRGAVDSF